MYDCIIIGAGISGCSLAFELSKYAGKVLVLEKNNDVADETTKANSAIIHAGYDPMPNTCMAKYNVEGNKIIPKLCEDLDVDCDNIGSLVIGFDESDQKTLETIYQRGLDNGVSGMKLLSKKETLEIEPNLNKDVYCSLYAPSACIINPWQFTIALSEVAIANGVEFKLSESCTSIKKQGEIFIVNGQYKAAIVVNCAGVYSDQILGLLRKPDYHIKPNKGEYYLLDKSQGELVRHVIFQCPNANGKGVLVAPTVHGNLIVGPSSQSCDQEDVSTSLEGLALVKQKALKSVPTINFRENIRTFAGVRARSDMDDFIVGEDHQISNFYSMAGMASPGLSSANAIVLDLVRMFQEKDFFLNKKANYVSSRRVVRFNKLSHEERKALIEKNPLYGRIICRCESISEGEIVDAIHRCPTPISIDAIKRRCNAGMGRCQSGFCGPKVQAILARELGVNQESILQDKNGSFILYGRTKEDSSNV